MRIVAQHAARGLSSGEWYEPVYRLILVFLLVVGYVAMGRSFSREREPLRAVGLVARVGWGREFGVGAAVGWGLLLLTILPSVFIGGLVVRFWTAPHQWLMLPFDIFVLLAAAVANEVVFRGYPFQRLIAAVGPALATLFMSLIFAMVRYNADAPRAAVFTSFLLSWVLCLAYLRTRALWVPIGLHFLWNASMGILFGLPISGYTRFSSLVESYAVGPYSLTGGDYGPEGSTVAVFVLIFGLWWITRATRDYAYHYAHPEIVPGGIPVDIDAAARRQHEAAMGPSEAAVVGEPKLVQIGAVPPASAPPPGE